MTDDMKIEKDDNPFTKPLLERLTEITPQKSLFDLIFENPDARVFTFEAEAGKCINTEVCEDPLNVATFYFMRTRKPAIVITDKFYTILKNGPDFMASLKLAESIRQAECFKSKENGAM